MSELKTEEEQIEALKTWWKKNGIVLVIAIAAAVSGYFGWNAWKNHQASYISSASALYQDLVQASTNLDDKNNQKTISYLAKQLTDEYGDTGYAIFAQFFVARLDAKNGKYDDAITALDNASSKTDDVSFKAIADLRIARLMLQKQDFTKAMARVEKISAPEFAAEKQELIGDILLAQGKRDDARVAYEKASKALGGKVSHPLLDIKLKDLVKS